MSTQINPAFFEHLHDTSRYLVLVGGAGSGKSYFAAQKLLHRITNERHHRILIVRKVAKTIRNSQFLMLKDVARSLHMEPDNLHFMEDRMEVQFPTLNSSIISMGVDDPEKLKSLAQPTSIWVEEATELTAADFRQLDLRLRGIKDTYMQIILSFNPINKKHWLYNRFFTQPDPNALVLQTTYTHNRFLDNHYKDVLEGMQQQDEEFYKVYALGQWGNYNKGLIYSYQLTNSMPECDDYIYGLDFGYNNPTALVKVGMKDGHLYATEVLYKTQLTNAQLIQEMQQLISYRYHTIYADAAEPARIAELQRAGFVVHPADKSVLDGIDHVKRYPLHVVAGSKNLINELDSYSWKENGNGAHLDEPEKWNDHACDALRYAVFTHTGPKRLRILGFA